MDQPKIGLDSTFVNWDQIIRMSHWRHCLTEGAEFWISCLQLKLLRKAGRLQLIQNSVPSVTRWRQCDIWTTFICKPNHTSALMFCSSIFNYICVKRPTLVVKTHFWSNPKQFGHVQINFDWSKLIWTDPKLSWIHRRKKRHHRFWTIFVKSGNCVIYM